MNPPKNQDSNNDTLSRWEAQAKVFASDLDDTSGSRKLGDRILTLIERVRSLEELIRKKDGALNIAQEALQWSEEMFMKRDEMNSKVHCAPLRKSPITERVLLANSKSREALALTQSLGACDKSTEELE